MVIYVEIKLGAELRTNSLSESWNMFLGIHSVYVAIDMNGDPRLLTNRIPIKKPDYIFRFLVRDSL
jgi:hypothetical protein